jgi:signal transduction histidine kinase
VHAELVATRELFADATRTAERLRISRELHDALGHHLTALSLQLEIARNVAKDDALTPVERAHALTKELLAELRAVVGEMREEQPIELGRALVAVVSGIERPRVHLALPDELRVEPAVAHAIFRCVQEALTNVVRHAGAQNLHVTIEADGDRLSVTARDDGHGAEAVRIGNGLTGLSERVEALGGSVAIEGRPGEGFTFRALLPQRGGPA